MFIYLFFRNISWGAFFLHQSGLVVLESFRVTLESPFVSHHVCLSLCFLYIIYSSFLVCCLFIHLPEAFGIGCMRGKAFDFALSKNVFVHSLNTLGVEF